MKMSVMQRTLRVVLIFWWAVAQTTASDPWYLLRLKMLVDGVTSGNASRVFFLSGGCCFSNCLDTLCYDGWRMMVLCTATLVDNLLLLS